MFAIALVLACVCSLCSCGGGGQTGGDGTSALRVGWTSEPDVLNPLTSNSTESLQVTSLVYEPLVGYSANLETACKLAESYAYSDDGMTVTYRLRHGVKWHDDEDFTAEDVVGTYNIVRDCEFSKASAYTGHLEKIYAQDDYTVVMEFSEPQAFNLAYAVPILPMHIWGGMSEEDIRLYADKAPIGTGPMRFVEWKQGDTVTLAGNADYYGEEPGPPGIVFTRYGNEDAMVQALTAGDLDIVAELGPSAWESMPELPDIRRVSLPGFSFHMVGINCSDSESSLGNPMLRDKTVRQALSCAMDRVQITEIALASHGLPGSSLLPPGLLGWHYDVPEPERMDGDIEKAKKLLEGAGYTETGGSGIREKDGQKMAFRMIAQESSPLDVQAAQMFQSMAREAGIELLLSIVDESAMAAAIFGGDAPDFDLFVWHRDSDCLDPSCLTGMLLTSQIGAANDVRYSNPEFDALYLQQIVEMDPVKRKELVGEMQKIFYGDAAYLIMWNQDKLQAYRTDRFAGWVETPGGVICNVTYDNYTNIKPLQAAERVSDER